MVKRKLSKKEMQQDEVFSFLQKVMNWTLEKRKPLIIGGLSIFLIVVAVWGISSWMGSRERHAAHLFARAFQDQSIDDEILNTVVERYGSTSAGRSASLLLGLRGDEVPGDSIAFMQKVLPKLKDPALRAITFKNIITLMMDEKQYEEALLFVDSSGSKVPDDLKLFMKGQVEETKGDFEVAKATYEELIDTFQESPYTSLARTRTQGL